MVVPEHEDAEVVREDLVDEVIGKFFEV